jgi:hypothetical protein
MVLIASITSDYSTTTNVIFTDDDKIENIKKQIETLQSDFKEIGKKLNDLENPKYSEYSIQMIASKSDVFKSFNLTTGKGFGYFTNWYLCNELNGTPNLNNKNNEKLFKYIIYITEPVKGIYNKNKSLI